MSARTPIPIANPKTHVLSIIEGHHRSIDVARGYYVVRDGIWLAFCPTRRDAERFADYLRKEA